MMLKQKRLSTYLLFISVVLFTSCATRQTLSKGETAQARSKDADESYIAKFTTSILEYYERKQSGEEDKHPAKKNLKPKIIHSN